MVSKIATGYTTDAKGRAFRRRHLVPGVVLIAVVAVVAAGAWIYAFSGSGPTSYPTDCNPPAAAAGPDKKAPDLAVVSSADIRSAGPAPLSSFGVRVLNAAAERGSAQSVSDDLASLGYRQADPAYADDTLYPERNLECVAQIRFGPSGLSAAAAVWLAAPCAQLVNDGRAGTEVDLALGAYFTSTRPSQDAQAAIEALRVANPRQQQPPVDAALLDAVAGQSC